MVNLFWLLTAPSRVTFRLREKANISDLCWHFSTESVVVCLLWLAISASAVFSWLFWSAAHRQLFLHFLSFRLTDFALLSILLLATLALNFVIWLLPARLIGDNITYHAFSRWRTLGFWLSFVLAATFQRIPISVPNHWLGFHKIHDDIVGELPCMFLNFLGAENSLWETPCLAFLLAPVTLISLGASTVAFLIALHRSTQTELEPVDELIPPLDEALDGFERNRSHSIRQFNNVTRLNRHLAEMSLSGFACGAGLVALLEEGGTVVHFDGNLLAALWAKGLAFLLVALILILPELVLETKVQIGCVHAWSVLGCLMMTIFILTFGRLEIASREVLWDFARTPVIIACSVLLTASALFRLLEQFATSRPNTEIQ